MKKLLLLTTITLISLSSSMSFADGDGASVDLSQYSQTSQVYQNYLSGQASTTNSLLSDTAGNSTLSSVASENSAQSYFQNQSAITDRISQLQQINPPVGSAQYQELQSLTGLQNSWSGYTMDSMGGLACPPYQNPNPQSVTNPTQYYDGYPDPFSFCCRTPTYYEEAEWNRVCPQGRM